MAENILVTGGAGFIGSHLVDALITAGHQVCVFDNLDPQVHGELREQAHWPDYCNPSAEYILGDVRDRAALKKAIRGVDVIFHQAAAVGVGQSMYKIEHYVDVNTRGTSILLDILVNDSDIRSRLRKLIVASSMSIYGEGKYQCCEHGIVFPKLRTDQQLRDHDWEMRCPKCTQQLTPLPTDEEKPLHATSIYAFTKKDQEEMCLSVGRAYKIPTVALRYFNVYGPRQKYGPYSCIISIFINRLF